MEDELKDIQKDLRTQADNYIVKLDKCKTAEDLVQTVGDMIGAMDQMISLSFTCEEPVPEVKPPEPEVKKPSNLVLPWS